MSYPIQLAILCPLVFLAGFIDSVAGGGGLISTPAYMIAGLPMDNVLGTNKVMSTVGTSMAAGKYIKSGKTIFEILKKGCDHHPHGLQDNTPLIEFALKYYN